MNIGIDGRALQGHRTGIGRYVHELCKRLDVELPEATFFVYTNRPIELPCKNMRWILRLDTSVIGRFLKPVLWTKFRAGYLCKKDKLTIFWATTTFLPKLHKNVKTVATIYDFNYRIVPKTMKYSHLWAHKFFFSADLMKSTARITISQGTALKIKKYYNMSVDAVINPAADHCFIKKSEIEILNVLDQFHINKPYILALGTLEPRKNLSIAIDAFLRLKENGQLSQYSFVIVGSRGWKDKKILFKIKSHPSIIHLGFVDDKQLPQLYGGSDIFLFPSFYEGYGMPVLEALKCGTKVVASDITEIREIGGKENIEYIEPTINGIIKGILAIKDRVIKEVPLLPNHTWSDDGKALADIFSSLVKK